MKRAMKLGMLAGVLLAATAGQTKADLQVFDFSFTNDGSLPETGGTPGTVTGEVVLSFSGDGSGSASLVSIDSIPIGLTNIYGSLPINATSWSNQVANEFTVSLGVITAADFLAIDTPYPGATGGAILELNHNNALNDLQMVPAHMITINPGTGNLSGLAGIAFTPVPEPSTLNIAGLAGVCGIAYVVANKRRA